MYRHQLCVRIKDLKFEVLYVLQNEKDNLDMILMPYLLNILKIDKFDLFIT